MKSVLLLSLVAAGGLLPHVVHTADAISPVGLRNPDVHAPVVPVANALESLDRGGFFIGNTIANLRGLDPVFAGRTLTMIDGRRRVGAATTVGPASTLTSKLLALPVAWQDAPVSERRACGSQGCSASADLIVTRADGSTRMLATNLSGRFIALPHSHQVFDCAEAASTTAPASPAIVDLNGTMTMLPSHPGPLRGCARTGTGDEVLLVYGMVAAGKAYTLARVFDSTGALLAEGTYKQAGAMMFRVAGEPHAAIVPGP